MLRLLKYEMRKTLTAKIVLLGLTVVLQAFFLYGYWKDRAELVAAAAALLFFAATFGMMAIGIQSLITLHRDMNTRQGYMLFMTPNSCYKILGAKVLECGLSLLIAGAFFFAIGLLDVDLILRKGNNQSVWDYISQMLHSVDGNLKINTANALRVVFWLISSWLCTVTMAFFADTLSSSLLNGKKFNMLVTFLFFIVLDYGGSKLMGLVPAGVGTEQRLIFMGLVALVLSALMYWVTAKLMEKYLSV